MQTPYIILALAETRISLLDHLPRPLVSENESLVFSRFFFYSLSKALSPFTIDSPQETLPVRDAEGEDHQQGHFSLMQLHPDLPSPQPITHFSQSQAQRSRADRETLA